MAKRCLSCGHLNDSGLPLCSQCGMPMDDDMRLLMKINDAQKRASAASKEPVKGPEHDEDVEVPAARKREEKKSPLPWILLGAVVVVAVVVFLVL